MPANDRVEIRTSGLWCEVADLVPGVHTTFDLEAFAVALDDPLDVFAGAFGMRTALGAELDWETVDDVEGPTPVDSPTDFAVPCLVTGVLLVGHDTLEVDGWGWRSYRLGDHQPARSEIRGRSATGGWVWSQGIALGQQPGLHAPVSAEASVDGVDLDQWCLGLGTDEPAGPGSTSGLTAGWVRQPRVLD